ncbi:hypothetical protein VW35_05805 [Devosia soli]|uniref:DUF3828 domain-containing protein n=1 Tax=Devosia soli TaxID=361041 RepID=A0A0F5LEE6_9HYPH|nr:hypothetical protein [Devosia soli]KKB79977.1 hypothetical protein VW35_05805 [Devosia soli]
MLRTAFVLASLVFSAAVSAAELPKFDTPKPLLEAIYGQYEAIEAAHDYNPDDYFDETEAYSTDLKARLEGADARVKATGDEMGALDFSPFINGQDTGGLSYTVHEPKIKGQRAVADVDIILEGALLYTIGFHLIEDGTRGWKIDDILLPDIESSGTWSLAEYLESLPAS